METLIWIDWVIIALITVSTVISLKRGFVKEAPFAGNLDWRVYHRPNLSPPDAIAAGIFG